MSKEEYSKLLTDVGRWNEWRLKNPAVDIDLSGEDLSCLDLSGFLGEEQTDHHGFVMFYESINLKGANLRGSNLEGCTLIYADLKYANLREVNFRGAHLQDANLDFARLDGADFTGAIMSGTTLANNDLSAVKGLEAVKHLGPSTIGLDTLYISGGKIPEEFLKGCGVPDEFIAYLPSLIEAEGAIQFYSCFISYSSKDEEFAKRLYARLREEHLRVWFAPEHLRAGRKLHEEIDRAIQLHDRLLLVISENSMQSNWVTAEIRNARKVEIEEKRRKLFPIRLVDFDAIKQWDCFDADTGNDLANEIRQYFIPDFSRWQDSDEFETAFARLLRDLKPEEIK